MFVVEYFENMISWACLCFFVLLGFKTNLHDNSSDNLTTCCSCQSMWFDHRQRWCKNQRNTRSSCDFYLFKNRITNIFFLDNRCICSSCIGNVTNINRTRCYNLRKTRINRILFSTNLPDYARGRNKTTTCISILSLNFFYLVTTQR